MQPTKEEEQWFWEQCGLKQELSRGLGVLDGGFSEHTIWVYPNLKRYDSLPPIDLNNLFEYTVPDNTSIQFISRKNHTSCILSIDCGEFGYGTKTYISGVEGERRYALALFWAIYKAMGGKEWQLSLRR